MSTRRPPWAAPSPAALSAALGLVWLASAACAAQPITADGITARHDLPSAVRSAHEEQLDPAIVESTLEANQPYRIGPGDGLQITVFRHPEFNPALLGARADAGLITVENAGTIQFPLLGTIKIAGLTCDEARALMMERLLKYIPDPDVLVQVQANRSLRYYLLGEFAQPGIKFTDRPLRLLEALSLGSVSLGRASLRRAFVVRHDKKLPINFERLLRRGDITQNVGLQTGDTIVLPDSSQDQVYVFGGTQRGAAVPIPGGRLNLLQALSLAGFGYADRFAGKLSEIRVIRPQGDRGEYFVVDADLILKGEAAPFMLEPEDIVFVSATALTDWNQAIQQILPSLQSVGALLNPFVSIKYLSE